MKKIFILLVLLFSTSVSSLVWGAENYDDCILKNMKGIGSEVAAKAIKDACKAKHINTIFSICVETEAQIINGIIFLPNMNEPFTGNNLCEYINGQVKSKGEIKDGKFDGKWTFWSEIGQKGLEKNYKDGKLDGKSTWWYGHIGLDGQIRLEKHYKDGKKDGRVTSWYENGQILSEEHYKDVNKDGKSTWWSESGQILSEKNYKDNKCISGDC